jgi:hypothetical protein
MQTFLTSSNYCTSAKHLDDKRLLKQRVEVIQILKALKGYYSKTGAWEKHPATLMWHGHESSLAEYGIAFCRESKNRGFKDTCEQKILELHPDLDIMHPEWDHYLRVDGIAVSPPPKWLGYKKFHDSHRSNLIRKDRDFYSKYRWEVSDDLPYYWPSKESCWNR